jgi:uridine kinase
MTSRAMQARLAGVVCSHYFAEGESMTTTTAERTQGTGAPEREGEEQVLHPLLLAALMRRRKERGESLIEHPLLLAALMRRREDDDEGVEQPLLLAALMRRRKERGESLIEHPLLLAALVAGR